jgi:hypothetical protein
MKEFEQKDKRISKGFPNGVAAISSNSFEAWKHMDGGYLFVISKQSQLR